jgi:hypothetical protein
MIPVSVQPLYIYSNQVVREANKWDSLRTSIQLEMCERVEFLRVNKRRRDEKLFVGCCNPTEERRSVWFGALWYHRTHSAFLSDESHLHIDFPHRGHHRKRIRWDTQCHCAPFWLHYSSRERERERASAPLQGIPRSHAATAMCSAHLFRRLHYCHFQVEEYNVQLDQYIARRIPPFILNAG